MRSAICRPVIPSPSGILMRRSCLSAILLVAATAFAPVSPAQTLPEHPRLLFNRQGLEQFQKKIAREPWTKAWAAYKAEIDSKLEKPVELPPRGGNWSHNYVCPTHGARLREGRNLGPWQWEHHCEVGPHVLRGDPSEAKLDFDGNAIMSVHAANAAEIRDLGLVYQMTRDARYADRARSLLLAYAERYLSYPMHNNRGKLVKSGGGRVASQSLTEATWLIPVVQGADLVWDTLSEAQREAVAQKLLRPALEETILNTSTKPVIHNIQCHRNSAVGLVGLLLGDKRLIAHAIDGVSGFRANAAQGVQADGVWFEGAWGYHFYTIQGLWPLAEAARNCGISLYGEPFGRMFDAPLQLATPTFRLPAFNDSREVDVRSQADLYELAYARYQNPAYAALLAASPRKGNLALWFGADALPSGKLAVRGSRNAEASGYAVLQQGEGTQATWLCLKYGPHGGGHGHPDKNNIVLYSRGRSLMPDAGSHAYGSPLHGSWDKTTFTHNTLVVDQKSQAQATGKCLAFGSAGGADFAMTEAGKIYPGVRFVRTVVMLDANLVVFVDQVQCEAERMLDLVCHHEGRWEDLPAGEPFSVPKLPGYEHLRDATTRQSSAEVALPVRCEDKHPSRIYLAAGQPTEVITATGVGKSTEDRVPVVVFRRTARQTSFVWCISLDGAMVELDSKAVDVQPAQVTVKQKGDAWRLSIDTAKGVVEVVRQ